MKQSEAIVLAKHYALKWGAPWGTVSEIRKERAWWLLFRVRFFHLTIESEAGRSQVTIDSLFKKLWFFEFIPTDTSTWMLPLWGAYPIYNAVTIGWRMGSGEDYKYKWHAWWRTLSAEARDRYRSRYPEPDWGAWPGFYEEIAEVPAKPGNMVDLMIGRVSEPKETS